MSRRTIKKTQMLWHDAQASKPHNCLRVLLKIRDPFETGEFIYAVGWWGCCWEIELAPLNIWDAEFTFEKEDVISYAYFE